MRILISEFMDAPAVERLRARHEVEYDPKLVDDAPRLLQSAATADALIVRNRTQVRGELLAALTRCKVVGRLGVGLDNIDVSACQARGLQVIPATGANALSVAEYVICTAMMLLAWRLPEQPCRRGRAVAAPGAVGRPRDGRQDPGPDRLRLDRSADGEAGQGAGHASDRLRRHAGPRPPGLRQQRRARSRPGRVDRRRRRHQPARAAASTRRATCSMPSASLP